MQAGDKIRVIQGQHEGKLGEVLSRYQIEEMEDFQGGEFSNLWFIEFEDGSADIIQEALIELE